VTVRSPIQRDVDIKLGAIGQFSAVNRVELRAQVGGTLSEIHFEDGQIVHKGDLLFVIDPRPYEIKLAQAKAQSKTARSRFDLATNQLERSQSLRKNGFSTQETVDQRISEQQSAQAAIEDAESRIRDAELDLEYTKVTAPFTGRIGARQVSIGGLISGLCISYVGGYLGSGLEPLGALALLMVALMARPEGIFARPVARRV